MIILIYNLVILLVVLIFFFSASTKKKYVGVETTLGDQNRQQEGTGERPGTPRLKEE